MPRDDLAVTGDLEQARDCARDYDGGRSLERVFYTSQAVYEEDMRRIWCENWHWAGHVSQIPEPGDFFTFEFGTESVIVVRDREGAVRAHLNVCRHRGSRVCLEHAGTARVFSCPYHGWTYSLDGSLRGAQRMPEGFDKAEHGLEPVHVAVLDGLIFVSLAEEPSDLAAGFAKIAAQVAPFGFADMKVAHTGDYPVPANWKLAFENYLECYHCGPAHEEYSRSHSLKDPASMTPDLVGGMEERAAAAGISTEAVSSSGLDADPPGADVYHRRYPLYPGFLTGSRDGTPLAPPLGTITAHDGGATDVQIGPLNYFLVYADHVVGYRFLPRGVQDTLIQSVWMVRADAEEGKDYDVDQLTWLWHVTTQDDERIIRHNQEGVNSMRYRPGPLATQEWGIEAFLRWYCDRFAD